MKLYGAADPGKSGAIVFLNDKGLVHSKYVLPTIGKQYDLPTLFNIIRDENNISHFALEDVHAVFSAGSSSSFEFGFCKGMLEMVLVAMQIPYTCVQPKAWQKVAWEGVTPVTVPTSKRNKKTGEIIRKVDTKATSLIACQRLFPNEDLRSPDRKTERGTKAHDGIVDSLLIAYYLFKSYNKN